MKRERPPLPARPFRDSAIVYGVLAGIIVAVSLVTGGSIARAFVIAIGFFVIATAWSWWRFRARIEQRGRR